MLIFFGTISLICITKIASTPDKNLSPTSQCIQPIEYNISLKIQNNTNLIVNSTVVLNVSCAQHHIRLQIERYCILNEINIQTNIRYDFLLPWNSTRLQSSSKHRFDIVDIRLDADEVQLLIWGLKEQKPIESGIYTISSICNCSLKEVATIFNIYRNQETKEFLILPRIPNEWIFPCWENPATKAKFTIQIEHKITDTAVSNMPGTFEASSLNTVFSTTSPISTHLVAFCVIPNVHKAHSSSDNNVIIRSRFTAKNDTFYAQTLIRDIIKVIRQIWNDIIPQSHVYYLLLPLISARYESIVTLGFVFLNDANIVYNTEIDSIVKEREVTCIIARSVIQEMFSDWLATFRQSDSWFIEGFSTVYGVYIRNQVILERL